MAISSGLDLCSTLRTNVYLSRQERSGLMQHIQLAGYSSWWCQQAAAMAACMLYVAAQQSAYHGGLGSDLA